MDTWLAWHLTGNRTHVTDVSNASRTMLFNIHTNDWDDELLSLLRVPRALLPDVHPSSHSFGMVPAATLGEPLLIAGIAGDQQAAMFGQACHAPGMAKNTYGTGCFLLLHTGDKVVQSSHGLVSTACAQTAGKEYALEGSVFVGGAVVQWLRDQLHFFSSSSEIERLAAEVIDSGDVFLVPAFTGLGAPYWDPHARGTIVGLTRGTTKAHIARAALEAIAYQSAEVLEAMQKDSGEQLAELRVDGGAAANDLLMQFQADLLGAPVVRPRDSRDDGPWRRLPCRPHGGPVEIARGPCRALAGRAPLRAAHRQRDSEGVDGALARSRRPRPQLGRLAGTLFAPEPLQRRRLWRWSCLH